MRIYSPMEMKTFVGGPLDNNYYLLIKGKECILIDGGDKIVLDYIKKNKLKLTHILITHGHGDHIWRAFEIKKETKAKLIIHKNDEAMMNHPLNKAWFAGITIPKVEEHFKDKLKLLGYNIKVFHTPGHSAGGVCLYFEKEKILFSGDTLFKGSIGRTDLPTANPKEMKKSLLLLMKLPDNVKVYPGHGENTSIGLEKKNVKIMIQNYL